MNDVYVRTIDMPDWISKHFKNKDLVSIDELIGCIETLDNKIYDLNEELENLKKDIEDNYKRKTVAEQVGITDKDFV